MCIVTIILLLLLLLLLFCVGRRDITLLRRMFTELQQQSQHLPKHLRLRQDEFIMDPSISEQLQQHLSDKVRERREGERERGGEGRERGRGRGSEGKEKGEN